MLWLCRGRPFCREGLQPQGAPRDPRCLQPPGYQADAELHLQGARHRALCLETLLLVSSLRCLARHGWLLTVQADSMLTCSPSCLHGSKHPVLCMAVRTASMWGAPAPVGPVFWDSNGILSQKDTSEALYIPSDAYPNHSSDDIIHVGFSCPCHPVLWDSSGNLSLS